MESTLLLQADALELDFGTEILEDLTDEILTRKGQAVRLFDQTNNSAEVYYPGSTTSKPAIHNHATGEHWFPITAYMEVYGLTWKEAVTALADQYMADGLTPDIARRITRQRAVKEQVQAVPPTYHDAGLVARSLNAKHYPANFFARYLRRLLGQSIADELLQRFNVGTSFWHQGGTVFWQQDTNGNYRAGKIIAYAGLTGKRRKEDQFLPRWAHEVQRLPDFHLVQCLFGEQQLPQRPEAPVGVVESEKTAIILSALIPSIIWLATGGAQNLGQIARCGLLQGRRIALWPDLDVKFECYAQWEKKAAELRRMGFDVTVSQFLRENATVNNRINKMDVADFLTGPDKRCPDTGRLWAMLQADDQPPIPATTEEMPVSVTTLASLITAFDLVEVGGNYDLFCPATTTADVWGVEELAGFFATATLPESFRLSKAETVSNTRQFVEGHLSVIQRNNGATTFLPYLHRLQSLRSQLQGK